MVLKIKKNLELDEEHFMNYGSSYGFGTRSRVQNASMESYAWYCKMNIFVQLYYLFVDSISFPKNGPVLLKSFEVI